MPSSEWPDDDDPTIRQSYNFAPGYHGLVYRADTSDNGASLGEDQHDHGDVDIAASDDQLDGRMTKSTKYKLQGMKWGLIPFWTKRQPDYGSMMRTINCRDDSLATSGGMWNTMKQKKRCIVVCEGFFEWQKKNNGKEKIPHFIKRTDGQLLCFAGLWDCVKYEGAEDKLYTYTIITTSSNKQLGWLHDRMPVILDNGSDAIRTWLDPSRAEWSKELQQLLKPYDGDLEYFPVDQAVGKVGNNSPSFVVPVASKENKKNIANFFNNQAQSSPKKAPLGQPVNKEEPEDPESNAPLPKEDPDELENSKLTRGVKREASDMDGDGFQTKSAKIAKHDDQDQDNDTKEKTDASADLSNRKTRSATSNNVTIKSPAKKDGSLKITNFFGK
ncbi:hypothetical protein ANO11243_090190 [Dothideomycetidae sp. 11243]|nr:hypothetical protein ANO11243_090190 [fungal sp. No.11243]